MATVKGEHHGSEEQTAVAPAKKSTQSSVLFIGGLPDNVPEAKIALFTRFLTMVLTKAKAQLADGPEPVKPIVNPATKITSGSCARRADTQHCAGPLCDGRGCADVQGAQPGAGV